MSLPTPAYPLVGRTHELSELKRMLSNGCRLVTLTATGGSGKSRLALEVTRSLAERFRDGVAFVELAPLEGAGVVPAAVAQELGIAQMPGLPVEQTLADALSERELLVCLDNFEHVLEAAPLVRDLVAAAPCARFLVTSRTPLHLSAEQEYPLAPLPPSDALEFFTLRAQAHNPSFQANAAVEQICRRLDGLPLALELAAARTRLLSPAQILDRLQLALLSGGPQDLPDRHRTLTATIDWSYRTLTKEEQKVFARMSVFSGGCTLDAVEAVCAPDELDAFGGVGSLLDKSLIRRRDDGVLEPRFWMLETLREYAAERLHEEGVAEDLRARMAEWVTGLAERAGQESRARMQHWTSVVRDELDNVRAAVRWGVDHRVRVALGILEPLSQVLRGLSPKELLSWLDEAVTEAADCPPALRARALAAASVAWEDAGETQRAIETATESAQLLADLGDPKGKAITLSRIGFLHAFQGRYEEAIASCRAALDAARELEHADDVLVRLTVNYGVSLLESGDPRGAIAVQEEALALAERRGARADALTAMSNLAEALLVAGEYARAEKLSRAALTEAQAAAHRQLEANTMNQLALAILAQGDAPGAERLLRDSAAAGRSEGLWKIVEESVEGLACTSALRGASSRAAKLWGAGLAARVAQRRVSFATERLVEELFIAPARRGADEAEWERLEAEGGAMSLEEAVAFALDSPGEPEQGVVRKTFMFTDVVDSTRLLEVVGDDAWSSLVGWHDRTLRALFAQQGGEEVDHAGDGFFVAFATPREAVACAVSIQRVLAEHRREAGFAPQVRVGIHEAEATSHEGGFRGIGVHTAARVGAIAGGGEIVASAATAALTSAAASELGEISLKGLAEPLAIVSILWRA